MNVARPEPAAPVEIAVAVVERDGEFLIGLRPPGAALAAMWEFPGGKIEPGETPAEAAARECREETGISVRVGACLVETTYDYPHACVRLHFLRAMLDGPSAEVPARFRWVPLAALADYEFPPANAKVLRLLRETGQLPPVE